MAAAAVCYSPGAFVPMAGRRVPLSNLPNVGNSPLRDPINNRPRSRCGLEDVTQEQGPPSKKHAFELNTMASCTPRKQGSASLSRKVEGGAIDRRQAVTKQKERFDHAGRQDRTERAVASMEDVRQWQRFYRRVMPTFVFYFESVPKEAKQECVRQLNGLGAVGILWLI